MDAVGIGDLHLSSINGIGAWSKYWPGNSDEAILSEAQKAVDYAMNRGISNIFIYGDICDAPKMSYQAHEALLKFFNRNSSMDFYIILGNHEMLTADSEHHALSLLKAFHNALPNVHIYDSVEDVVIDRAKVRFLPFPHAEFAPDALNVCHVDVAGSVMDSGRPSKSTIEVDDSTVVVAGHIHTAGQVKHVYYSGTMFQTNFGQSEKKYFHLIHYNSPEDFDISLIPTHPELLLKTAIITTKADLDKILRESKNSKQKEVWRLIIVDGADVAANDYEALNVVQVKSYSTKQDLQDLVLGSVEYVSTQDIRPEDVFLDILGKREDINEDMKEKIKAVRKRVLKL